MQRNSKEEKVEEIDKQGGGKCKKIYGAIK